MKHKCMNVEVKLHFHIHSLGQVAVNMGQGFKDGAIRQGPKYGSCIRDDRENGHDDGYRH